MMGDFGPNFKRRSIIVGRNVQPCIPTLLMHRAKHHAVHYRHLRVNLRNSRTLHQPYNFVSTTCIDKHESATLHDSGQFSHVRSPQRSVNPPAFCDGIPGTKVSSAPFFRHLVIVQGSKASLILLGLCYVHHSSGARYIYCRPGSQPQPESEPSKAFDTVR